MNTNKMSVADYLGKTIDCECGRIHSIDIEFVEISSDAITKIPEFMGKGNFKNPFIIADENTYKAAGKRIEKVLITAGIPFNTFVFNESELVPDEHALGRLFINFNPDYDVIIAVGAGTINDISRFLSHRVKTPYYIVATAPSMDGYASTVAPLIRNDLKTTFECHMPRGIIADLEVIAKAPQEMIAAGFGDVLGKFTCLADWALSAIINDEYYCKFVVDITYQSLTKTIALREQIAKGDRNAIAGLMESLVLAGLGMSYVGNSRPASGSEHHLSHFWEMRLLFDEKPAVLHGIKVGLATINIASLYQRLGKMDVDKLTIERISAPDNSNWNDEIHRVFLDAADEVIAIEQQVGKNSPEAHKVRIKSIANNWEKIREVLDSVPEPELIIEYLRDVNGPTKHEQVGISHELVVDAILFAKEVRPRYTILQLLWDLNLLKEFAYFT